jgi:hypothetical protein
LSPIEEWSSDGHLSSQAQVPEAMTTPLDDNRWEEHHEGAAAFAIEEPHVLRRILTLELQKLIEGIELDLQKTQVWSRVVREVLRGTRRRIRSPPSHR